MPALRIVIVEDDEPTLEMLRDALSTAGYCVECINSGRDAYERICALQPDLVLLDLWMETCTSGEMILALLELDQRTKHTPVIISSAHIQPLRDLHSRMLERKHLFLDKPYSIETLFDMLSTALEASNKQQPTSLGDAQTASAP